MNKRANETWALFNSLSQSEKRYLNLAVQEQADAPMAACYAALQAPGMVSEAYSAYLGEVFPDSKDRSKVRRKLYLLMLDALVGFAEKKDPDLRLHKMILRCRVLLSRGLPDQADKLIRQGMRLAAHFDRKWALAVLSEIRAHREGLHKLSDAVDPKGDARFQDAYLLASDYAALSLLRYQDAVLVKLFNEHGTVGQGKSDFFSETQLQAQQAQEAPGFFTPYFGIQIESTIAFLRNDQAGMVQAWAAVEELFGKFPHLIQGNTASYFKALHFRSLMALAQQDAERSRQILTKLKEARPSAKAQIGNWGQMYYSSLGQYAINVGCEHSLKAFVQEVPKFLLGYAEQMDTIYVLLLSALQAVSHYMLNEYSESLRWVQRYLYDDGTLQMRKGIQVLTTLRLCIYVDIEDWDALEHAWNSAQAYLGKHIVFPKFWRICQRLFGGLLDPSPGLSSRELCRLFWEECDSLFGGGEEANLTAYFDFMAWGQSQAEGRMMREVVAYNFVNHPRTDG